MRPVARSWRGWVLAAVTGIVLVVAAVSLLWRAGGTDPGPAVPPASGPQTSNGPDPSPGPGGTGTPAPPGRGLGSGSDPLVFAEQVAPLLFDWDTGQVTRSQVRDRVLTVADPSGVETSGLVADLEGWLPEPDWWSQLAEHGTRQWIDVSGAKVPDAWTEATKGGLPGHIAPGTTAVTVTGVRHREAVVADVTATSAYPVAITLFITCTNPNSRSPDPDPNPTIAPDAALDAAPDAGLGADSTERESSGGPAGEGCWLLRLSVPGKVLE